MQFSSNFTTSIEARYANYIYAWTGIRPDNKQLARFFYIERVVEAAGKASEQIARKVMGLDYDGAGWETPYDYRVEPAPLDPQRNALRIEFIPPSTRCALKPLTEGAQKIAVGHPIMTQRYWSSYGTCTEAEGCGVCRIAHNGILGA